jgi:sugar/nucleoside kinase (ribokinase family)
VGRVGADVPGQATLQALDACGVVVRVTVDELLPTGTCVVLVDQSGERTMVPSPGANAALAEADVDAAGLAPGTHLHLSGYALFGAQRDTALLALRRAHDLGLSVSIGAASSAPLRKVGAETFLSWAQGATLFANGDEARTLVGIEEPADAVRTLAERVGVAVVTDGSRAAHWSDGQTVVTTAAPQVPVVDSTGAGDAFAAGFLAATFGRAAPGIALAHGHELAGRACGVVGARPVSGGT